MDKDIITTGKVHSYAEDLFIELFCDVFGPENSEYISVQYPFVDIYGKHRYILKGLIYSAENSITRINKITQLRDEHLKKIYSVDETKDNLLKLLGYMEKVPMFNIKMASEGIDLSFNTTAKAINILRSLDIIEQENELIRNRCYVYRKYKDIAFG